MSIQRKKIICRRTNYLYFFIVLLTLSINFCIAKPRDSSCFYDAKNRFIPPEKSTSGQWSAERLNPSNLIILSAGHVNRTSGTAGYNNAPAIHINQKKYTTEAVLVKMITPYMVKVGIDRGFNVEQFKAKSTVFREATLELARYEKSTGGIAFEIHSDVPSEGHHRTHGYNGKTGIIPPSNGTITQAEACVGEYLGKFKKGVRQLFAPKQGISLFELFPTNKKITTAVHNAIKTGNHSQVKKIVLPYIHLFYDALENSGMLVSR